MRTKLFIKNSFVSLVTKFLCYFVEFLCRTALIRTLPMEYVGVSGIFSNIISVLSLSELGFATVLVYSMYIPLAQNDEKKLLALTEFYKKAYRIITVLVGTLGIFLVPVLPYLIKDFTVIPHLTLIYLLYLSNTVLSYTFCYKQSLFMADQKMYITNFYANFFRIIRVFIQIFILLTTQNFILYLSIQLPFTLFTNVFLSYKAKKVYPFLNSQEHPVLDKDEKKSIYKDVYAVFNHRIGAIVLNSTDNLLISVFFGLVEISKNDSYSMVLTLLRSVFSSLFGALNSGIGNFHAKKTKEETLKLFETLHFAGFWLYTFCTAGFFLFINPMISLFWGDEFLFSLPIVFLLSVNFYILGIRQVPLTFKEALGLLCQDRYIPLIEASINLGVSVLLAKPLGVIGIFIGTFISMVSTTFWYEPYVLLHYGFGLTTTTFWKKNVKYLTAGGLSLGLTYLCSLYLTPLTLLPSLALRLMICILIPNGIFALLFHRTNEFHHMIFILKDYLKK